MIKDPFSTHPSATAPASKVLQHYFEIGERIRKSIKGLEEIQTAPEHTQTRPLCHDIKIGPAKKKYTKLNDVQKKALLVDSSKLSNADLAEKYGVTMQTVRNILKSFQNAE